jgi:hypothetical protein
LLIFNELTRGKNPVYPYWKHERIEIQLDDISDPECKAEFSFGMSELEVLAEALRISDKLTFSNGAVASG